MQFLLLPFLEYRSGFLVRKSLEEPIQIPAVGVAVTMRQATVDDLPLLETIVPPLRVRRLAKKMRAGEICFVAIQEERVMGYVFAGFANTPSTEDAQLELGPKEAYCWAGYALPQYRRQGVVGAINLSLCRLLREKGYESVFLQVDRGNRAALGHCYKMGYRVTEQVSYLRVLGWRVSRRLPIEEPVWG